MPGIVVFRRRWSVGSDDLVVPAALLLVLHIVWLTVLAVLLGVLTFDPNQTCTVDLRDHVVGYIIILALCILVEGLVAWLSMRGSILDTQPREGMQYLLYTRLVVFLGEFAWLVLGVKWLVDHYSYCQPDSARKAVLGIIVCNWCMVLIMIISLWCTFDSAGRKWVKMKQYQESMKEKTRRSRRSGSARRNWRQRSRLYKYFYDKMERKAFRAYEESWDRRFRLLCCCVERKGRNKNSMSEIAALFTEFFRDLDVVPSDVIAGLVLLRRYQKLRMQHTVQQGSNDVYRYLSGIPVTPRTKFLQLGQPEVLQQYKLVLHYMRFAMAAYGWPIFMMMNTGTGLCKMMPYFRCCCCIPCCKKEDNSVSELIEDNCCQCNLAALKKISGLPNTDLVYVTYHVDIGETPFYVALDHKYRKVVICVRGTLSLQDVLTDLKADAETLPLDPVKEEWVAHKGMVQAAIYIKKKLKEGCILSTAFEACKEHSTEKYDLVLVGHSLGAGTAAILAIMLQQEYTDLHCYAYSPPGGLLSYDCVEATKSFITSVVIGKDVVPRIGLSQMELLRTDLINIIKKSTNPKWKIILKALCCGSESASSITYDEVKVDVERNVTAHPSDEQIGLTAHRPLFPPGKIILVVRNHPDPKHKGGCCGSSEPVYQAIWADNSDFQEVLVSPTMVNDHMPDNVMEALEKVLVNVAPPKPTRLLTETERKALLKHDASPGTPGSQESPQKLLVSDDRVQCVATNISASQCCPTTKNSGGEKQAWEMTTEEILLSLDRESLFPGLGNKPRLELDLDMGWVEAPLASPENLSSSSSLSALSRTSSLTKDQKNVSVGARLETIQQSPEVKVRLETTDSDSKEVVELCDVSVDVNSSTTACDSNNRYIRHTGDMLLPVHSNPIGPEESDSTADVSSTEVKQNGHGPLHNTGTSLMTDEVSAPKNNNNNNIGILQPSSLALSNVPDTVVAYDSHSPDDCSQYGYGNPNEHYSAAAIGYHPLGLGGYHPRPGTNVHLHPDVNKRLQYSQSESYLQALSDKYQMKRSTEQRDIAHLQDGTVVFEGRVTHKPLQPMDSAPLGDSTGLSPVPRSRSGVRSEGCVPEEEEIILGKTLETSEENAFSTPLQFNPSNKRCSLEENNQGREPGLVNSYSNTSNTASSYSEGSDKRNSSTSGQSDVASDYPMEETDV